MKGKQSQCGASAFGFLCYTLAGVFTIMVLYKILPAYLENYSVKSIISSLDDRSDIHDARVRDVRGWINKGFLINGIRDIPEDAIKVRKKGDFLVADVNYERRVDLISNIDIVITFENSWKIKQQ
ncbi:DUF4845 domain-containing protein [Sansalvadorimonas verongulae]|uniref:DUF4845 domain-containing protein n=1 Tax=Sansalvadorimonas verongulae TaxID=2172824 RepID=UPI0012BBBA53|nr:DUF4845 domain-containing protein [Sansalvadorimonas verongulae]MTI14116.1 DUF4845 domain-containing protein [Sansalvadorimonas verongulae]